MSAEDDDPYAALALVYDDWQARYGEFSGAVLDRMLPLLDAEPQPVTSFFEAGCGTGTLLLGLAARRPRWRLAGADRSAAMLDRARAKPDAGRIAWHRRPVDLPAPDAPFDAAGCFFNTLNHLADAAQLGEALAALGASLRSGGLLMFDVNNRVGYRRWWSGHHVYDGPGWHMQTDARYDEARGEAQAVITIEREGRAAQSIVRERLFSDDQIAGALRAAGLRVESSRPWSPTPDEAPGSTFWIARRVPTGTFALRFPPGGRDGEHHDGP